MRAAGQRLAELLPGLSAADQDAFQACITRMFRALDGLTPLERKSAVDYAEQIAGAES